MRRHSRSRDRSAVAETVQQLAVLLQTGIAPATAWGHLAGLGHPAAIAIRAALDDGAPVAQALAHASADDAGPWSDVAAAWSVATTVGAPLAPTLRGLAAALRDAQQTADDVRIALAEPAGTARLMGWLPLVGVGLGAALGFDTLGVLTGSPLGIACLIAGAGLVVIARRWSASLVRRASESGGTPGLDAEIFAIALSGGVSIDRARALVAETTGAAPHASTHAVLALSRSAGVPAVELLRAAASLARHRARVDGRLRAARLSTRLLLPIGVCTLPAFLLLGVGPMLLSVVSAVGPSL